MAAALVATAAGQFLQQEVFSAAAGKLVQIRCKAVSQWLCNPMLQCCKCCNEMLHCNAAMLQRNAALQCSAPLQRRATRQSTVRFTAMPRRMRKWMRAGTRANTSGRAQCTTRFNAVCCATQRGATQHCTALSCAQRTAVRCAAPNCVAQHMQQHTRHHTRARTRAPTRNS